MQISNLTLHRDLDSEFAYACAINKLDQVRPLYRIKFGHKEYLLQNYQRKLSIYFEKNIPEVEENETPPVHIVALNYIKDEEAFDIIMKILLGFEKVGIPKELFFQVYMGIFELGIKKTRKDYQGINPEFSKLLEKMLLCYIHTEAKSHELIILFRYAIEVRNKTIIKFCYEVIGFKVLIKSIISNEDHLNNLAKSDFDYIMKLHMKILKKSNNFDQQEKFLNLVDFIEVIIFYGELSIDQKMEYLYNYSSNYDYPKINIIKENIGNNHQILKLLYNIFQIWKITYENLNTAYKKINHQKDQIQDLDSKYNKNQEEIQTIIEKYCKFEAQINDYDGIIANYKQEIQDLENKNLQNKYKIEEFNQDILSFQNEKRRLSQELEIRERKLTIELRYYEMLENLKSMKIYPMKISEINNSGIFKSKSIIYKNIMIESKKQLITCGSNGKIYISEYDVNAPFINPKHLTTLKGHKSIYNMILLSNSKLATVSADRTLRIWNLQEASCEKILNHHSDEIYALIELQPNILLTGSDDGTIIKWDLNNNCNYLINPLNMQKKCRVLAKLTETEFLAGSQNEIDMYKFNNHSVSDFTICNKFKGHNGFVISIKVINSNTIVTTATDKTLILWNVRAGPNTNPLLRKLEGHMNNVFGEPLLINDNLLFTFTNEIKVWNLKENKVFENAQPLTIVKNEYLIYCMIQISQNCVLIAGESTNLRILKWQRDFFFWNYSIQE